MKKILLISFVLIFTVLGSGCENINPVDDDYIPGEIPLEDPDLNPEEPLYGGCLVTYGKMVVNKDLPADMREWEGYHKLGNKLGEVPTRMLFSSDGNIKMYTKPFDIEDWQLVINFNVDRMKVSTEDENVDDIIEFPKAVDYCLFEDTKENASKSFPCITLYPEEMPIQENSPFNINLCINDASSITVDMLKHKIYLSN